MVDRDVPFVDDEDFLRGLFDSGVSFDDGVRELVDNALDAGARNVWVILDTTQGERMHLIVGDDGEGVPDTIEYDGRAWQGIPFVMAVGSGKNILERRKGQIGTFGFGLSSTITCLTRDTSTAVVYSRNADNEEWRSSHYNFDDLVANRCYLPRESIGHPPFHPSAQTGTIVDIELHGTETSYPGPHHTRLLSLLGRTYRGKVAEGIGLHVSVVTGKKSDVKAVRRSDPLALDPDAHETKAMGQARAYEVPPLVFDEDNPLGPVIDPATGTWAEITVRLSLIASTVAKRRLESMLRGKDAKAQIKVLAGLGIGHDGQGFALLREGREIDHGKTFGVYAKHNHYNWMHGDIDFPVCLDDLFTIQTNKSRFAVPPKVKDILKRHLKPYMDQVYNDVKSAEQQKAKVDEALGEEPLAERLARKVRPMLPQAPVDEEAIAKGEQVRVQMRDLFVTAVEGDFAPELERLRRALGTSRDEVEREEAQAAVDEAERRLEEMIARVRHRWSSASGARILEQNLGHQDIYEMRDAGDEAHIVVNTATPFHRLIYAPVSEDRQLRGLLDLMLLSIGYAEFFDGKHGDADLKRYWIRARQEVSLHADRFIQPMPVSNAGGEV